MKESKNKNNSQLKLIAGIIALSVCISVITSSIVVKTLVPVMPPSKSTPTTLRAIQPSLTVYVLPSATPNATPLQLQKIEANLLQNNGFESGLTGWAYTNNEAGITVFETTGINGKGYCSRRFLMGHEQQTEFLNNESIGIAQDISVDPTESYFFSAWVKLYRATRVVAYAKFYYDSEEVYKIFLNSTFEETKGTSNGWFLIQKHISSGVPGGLPTANHVVIGFWHDPIQEETGGPIDSIFCVDDIAFGKAVK